MRSKLWGPISAPPQETPLAYVVNLPSCTVECDSVEEAVALIRKLQDEGIADAQMAPKASRSVRSDPYQVLAQALGAVAEHGKGGVDSATLASWLGFEASNALGPKAKVWRRLIENELGFSSDSVWTVRPIARGHRRWFMGPQIQEAIEAALERATAGGK